MIGRVVEVSPDVPENRHIGATRGALTITTADQEPVHLTLDLIDALILPQHGATITTGALRKLAEHGIPVIICGTNYQPLAISQPLTGHYYQPQRLDRQISASLPLKKRTWADVVTQKVLNQAALLDAAQSPRAGLLRTLAQQIRSGDPTNIEAQAARTYWPALLGTDFRRRRDQAGDNQALNYGYAIIRATMARALVAAGLNPTLGTHHKGPTNPLRLADDLMEPFRPAVDHVIASMTDLRNLTPNHKRAIISVLTRTVTIDNQQTTLTNATHLCARSWAARLTDRTLPILLPTLDLDGPTWNSTP